MSDHLSGSVRRALRHVEPGTSYRTKAVLARDESQVPGEKGRAFTACVRRRRRKVHAGDCLPFANRPRRDEHHKAVSEQTTWSSSNLTTREERPSSALRAAA